MLYNTAGWTAVNACWCPNQEIGEAGRGNETGLKSKA